jgi:hypothetical protein
MAALVMLADARAVCAWRASGDVVKLCPRNPFPAYWHLSKVSATEQHARMAVESCR